MNQFNPGNFINRFINNPPPNLSGGPNQNAAGPADARFQLPKEIIAQNMAQKTMPQSTALNALSRSMALADLKMNYLGSMDRSLYIKDLMNLPKEMEELLVIIQKNLAANKDLPKLLTTNIQLSQIAELIQQNGKEALNKLVLAMANASKQGITDLSQIKETMKLINASVAAAGQQDNAAIILKNFMLLYLPWLPLKEGVDFELEIGGSDDEEEGAETSITIMISTINYGNVQITLVLVGGNSVSIIINCSEKFPKEELLERIKAESKSHALKSNVSFEQKEMKKDENAPRQAKVSLSNLKEVNPFLLLMANALIRHTIDLDNNMVKG